MLNILIVNEDINISRRLKTVLTDTSEIHYEFSESVEAAILYIEFNDIFTGIVSLELEHMSGDEIADILCEHNPDISFIFLYEADNIISAVEMYNLYDRSLLFDIKNLVPDDLKKGINDKLVYYHAEDVLKAEIDKYCEKEKTYKKTMNDMSSVLNSRISCYSRINKIFSKSIEFVCNDFSMDTAKEIEDFFFCVFGQFIHDNLVECPDLAVVNRELTSSLNDTVNMRHYQFVTNDINPVSELKANISFSSHFVSHMFAKLLSKYRIKLELKEGPKVYRLDIIADTRLGEADQTLLGLMYNCVGESLKYVCSKVETGVKDGIMQYRLYFLKNNDSASKETA